MNGVKLDGTLYHVRVVFNTLEQAFELMEGPNAGDMLSGRHERDLQGTAYSYQFGVERDPAHPDDYDAFFWAVSTPVDSHTVEMPSGQSTMTFIAPRTIPPTAWPGATTPRTMAWPSCPATRATTSSASI